jgi:hypothetical protein
MRKSVFGLAVAGATLAGVIGSSSPAGAVVYTYNGSSYNVTTMEGTFDALENNIANSANLLWGDENLAKNLAEVADAEKSQGYPNQNGNMGPYYAYSYSNLFVGVGGFNEQNIVFYAYEKPGYNQAINGWGICYNGCRSQSVQTWAMATAVPWETDALPVIGSTILFAGGLWARNKFAKPLQK